MEFNATFFVSIISFLIFTLIMNKILYKPITKIVEMREKMINENYNAAKTDVERADNIYKDREERLQRCAAENKKYMTKHLEDANIQAKQKTAEAKQNSVDEINAAKNELRQKETDFLNQIQGRIDEFAEDISAKILGEVK